MSLCIFERKIMKLLKYVLCASMCMSFGVAHAEWEHLGIVDKPLVWDTLEIYGYMYNSDQDTDNAMVLIRMKDNNGYYNVKLYMTASDCLTGQGVSRLVHDSSNYSPHKFNIINPKINLSHIAAIGMCNRLSAEDKFSKSDDLKVRKNIDEALKQIKEKL